MPQSKPEGKVAAFECGHHPASGCIYLMLHLFLSLSGWTPVVQSCAESFDRDSKWWAAWSCYHSRLHRPHQDLAGSDRPGGGLLLFRVSTLHVTTVQCQQQLVSDCKCSQSLWLCKGKDLEYINKTVHLFQVGTSQGAVCTLADSALAKRSSVMVCDSFKVNILLVSPDKKWIMAGTKDNDDLSPKVFLVVFMFYFLLWSVLVC